MRKHRPIGSQGRKGDGFAVNERSHRMRRFHELAKAPQEGPKGGVRGSKDVRPQFWHKAAIPNCLPAHAAEASGTLVQHAPYALLRKEARQCTATDAAADDDNGLHSAAVRAAAVYSPADTLWANSLHLAFMACN